MANLTKSKTLTNPQNFSYEVSHLRGHGKSFHTGSKGSKRKVNTQGLLFCLVHNIEKIHRYAPAFGRLPRGNWRTRIAGQHHAVKIRRV